MSSLLSSKKLAENLALAEENYEKAKKKAGTTLLRWKPDWEQAARYYREASKYYKLSGPEYAAKTIQTLRESAHAHKEIGSWHTAAGDLESAATLVRDEMKDNKLASELFAESALYFRTHGSSHDKAASVLVKAAEAIGDDDVNAGVEFMKQACSIFEEENRGMFHDATFKKAICFCINHKKFGSARSLLHRQIIIAQTHLDTFETDIYKNCLSIIVLRFHTEDYEKANEELMKFQEIARFSRSEYCRAADEMISAWEDGDAERFNAAVKSNTFKFLLNPVAVIARKLKMPEEVAKSSGGGASASSSSAAPKKSRGKKIDLEEEEEGDGEIDLR